MTTCSKGCNAKRRESNQSSRKKKETDCDGADTVESTRDLLRGFDDILLGADGSSSSSRSSEICITNREIADREIMIEVQEEDNDNERKDDEDEIEEGEEEEEKEREAIDTILKLQRRQLRN